MGESRDYVLQYADGQPLKLGAGLSHNLVLRTEAERLALLQQLSADERVWIVPEDGGLITNIRIWENLLLPVQYHGTMQPDIIAGRVSDLMAQCGLVDEIAVSGLLRKLPEQLSLYERRLVAFVRTLLCSPECIVYDFLHRGLTKAELECVIRFDHVFQQQCPSGTSVSLGFKPNEDASNERYRVHYL